MPPAELDPTWSDGLNPFAEPPKELPRVRKAYERVPRKAQSTQSKTRTVWKRPQNATLEKKAEEPEEDEEQSSTRGVKRQCLNQVPAVAVMVPRRTQPQGYVSTMLERVLGTPKRKTAPRTSLRAGLLEDLMFRFSPQKMLASAGLIASEPEEPASQELPTGDNFIDMLGLGTDNSGSTEQVENSAEQLDESNVPAAAEDLKETPIDIAKPLEDEAVESTEPTEPMGSEKKDSKSPRKTPKKTPRKTPQKSKVVKASETLITPSRRSPTRGRPRKTPKRPSEIMARQQMAEAADTQPNVLIEVRIPPVTVSPVQSSPTKRGSPGKSPLKKSPVKRSPQKQSPIKQTPLKRSPKKQITEKVDLSEQVLGTMSPEREIPKESQEESPIKNREALANPVQLSPEAETDDSIDCDENVTTEFSAMSVDSGDDASNEVSSDSSLSEIDETITVDDDGTVTVDGDLQDNTYFFEDMTQTGNIASMIGQISSPKLSKTLEPESQPLDSQQTESQLSESTNDTQEAADEDDILSTQPADDERPKREKYFSRFSDDTLMLKDFLSRAQAARAAKAAEQLGSPMYSSTSPRRSPRKVLGNLDNNSPSPSKSQDPVESSSNTQPGKPIFSAIEADEDDEITADPVSQRRSGRSRLPAPSRTAIGAPNFIPLRRADGEPILLQKTPAQELAITTRTNTRRNKGQSKMPKEILEVLNAEWSAASDPAPKKRDGKAGKTVGWDKTLVYFQEAADEKEKKPKKKKEVKIVETKEEKAEPKEEKTPNAVRKVKRLGALNGTPAPKPKKVTVESVTVATPTTRRRGRSAKE